MTEAPRAATPAAWGLSAVLCVVHLATGAWAVSTRRAPDAWSALVAERPVELRIVLGARDSAHVWDGQVWRLLTAPFVHSSLGHLLVNVVAVLVLGQLLEPRVGARRWLGTFVTGAVGAGLVSQLTGVVRTDGASGGAYALLGATIAWGRWADGLDDGERRWLAQGLGAFAAVNVLWSLIDPRLDAATHVGGLVIGAALGRVWARRAAA